MSKGVDGLFDDYLRQRWSVTSAPSAGTTSVANTKSVIPNIASRQRTVLEAIVYSVKNLTATASTVVMEVREASIAGTLLASVEIVTAAGASSADCYSQWYIPATRNNGNGDYGHLSVSFNTVQASVVQKLNVCGWLEAST